MNIMPECIWYFAYGSNLDQDRLEGRIGRVKDWKKAVLKGWEITFAKGWDQHLSGKANIKQPGDEVKGVIYLITNEQFDVLDGWEGVRYGVYRRSPVKVLCDGELVPSQTYVMVNEICPMNPDDPYLKLIIDGLEEHSYKDDANYINKVRKIAGR